MAELLLHESDNFLMFSSVQPAHLYTAARVWFALGSCHDLRFSLGVTVAFGALVTVHFRLFTKFISSGLCRLLSALCPLLSPFPTSVLRSSFQERSGREQKQISDSISLLVFKKGKHGEPSGKGLVKCGRLLMAWYDCTASILLTCMHCCKWISLPEKGGMWK